MKTKKLLLAAACMGLTVMAMTVTASAATYVPQKEVEYVKEGKKWVKYSETTRSIRNGRLAVETSKYYSTDTGKVLHTYQSKYAYKNGKLSTKKTYYNKGLQATTTYTYTGGKLTQQKYKTDYSGTDITTYSYKKGRLSKEITDYGYGGSQTITYTYDSKGRLKKVTTTTTDSEGGVEKGTTSYSKYDKYNNPKQVVEKIPAVLKTTYTYKYNKKGVMTQQNRIYYGTEKVYWKTLYSKFKTVK